MLPLCGADSRPCESVAFPSARFGRFCIIWQPLCGQCLQRKEKHRSGILLSGLAGGPGGGRRVFFHWAVRAAACMRVMMLPKH